MTIAKVPMTMTPCTANPLLLHLTIEAHRAKMVQLAGQYGLSDARVLRMSQRLDALIVREMKGEIEDGKLLHNKHVTSTG